MPTTSEYGDLAAILAVGALFYIGYQSFTNSAVIGAVAKDPCAGLTGATLAACRKAHPEYKGITPATPAKRPPIVKPVGVKSKPPIMQTEAEESPEGLEKYKVKTGSISGNAKLSGLCQELARVLMRRVDSTDPRMTITNQMYELDYGPRAGKDFNIVWQCAYRIAEQYRQDKLKNRKMQADDTPQRYTTPISPKRGEETYDKPASSNPLGQFVNSILGGLAQAWQNLTHGKTAIGGQPTVITGAPGVARPMVAPIA